MDDRLKPPTHDRPLSLASSSTAESDFSQGLGGERHRAVRFGEGARPNRTATQSMADFLRNVPPPDPAPSPTRSSSSVQDKIRKSPGGRLFGLGGGGGRSKDAAGSERSLTGNEDEGGGGGGGGGQGRVGGQRQGMGQVRGLQQVVTPSGQTVHLIPYRPPTTMSTTGSNVPPSSYQFPAPPSRVATGPPSPSAASRQYHAGSASVSSAASGTTSVGGGGGGPPVLPELRGMSSSSDDEGQTMVKGEFKARSASTTRTRSESATVEGTTIEVTASSLSQLNIGRLPSTFSSPNSTTTTRSNPSLTVTPAAFVPDRPVLARSGSSPAPGVDETLSQQGPVVFPSGPAPTIGPSTDDSAPTMTTTSGREPTVPAAAKPPLEALRAQEAVTLDLLGQRVERDAQGDLVLGRRVSKRTVGSQTTVSAVRSLLEGARERTTTVRSTRSADGLTNTAPSTPPSVRTKVGSQSTSTSRDDSGGGGPRRRFVSDAPTDASFVGGESDDGHGGGGGVEVDNGSSNNNNNKDEDRSSGSVHTAGTFGLRPPPSGSVPASPRSTTTTSAGGGGGPTPPPLMSSESRGSVSSNASGSSWSVPTPSVPSLPTSATFGSLSPSHGTTPTGGGGLHKPGSRSRLRPSTAPDRSISAETGERELLEGRLRALEEQLARETRERKEVEKRFKRLQVSSREGKARWEDMAGWAVEVIESADKDRHLLELENARLQKELQLYRAQYGSPATSALPSDVDLPSTANY